ncbi:MAG: 5-deoxy-D-ribulose 1-phosphate aldolase [Desulfovibrio sp.]
MHKSIETAKLEVLLGCKTICAKGYVLGTAGNISARAGDALFVITPTSRPYETLTADDLVVADMEGNIVEGRHKPSMEFTMHLGIYRRRPDTRAVVHTHSKYATAASAMRGVTHVPIIDIETAMYIGGDIRVAPFAPPGSADLAKNAVNALGDRAGVILEGHGAIAVGKTMNAAMVASDNVERACEIYLIVKAAGEVKELPQGPLEDLCAWSRKDRGIA